MIVVVLLSKSLLSLLPAGLTVDRITLTPERVVVAVHARSPAASCPLCRRRSQRVHGSYLRHLADLPWQGRAGQLDLQVRRFRCDTPSCPRRVFAEQIPDVARPRIRRTVRTADTQRRIALTAGGEAGARLAAALGMAVSGDTLLRLIQTAPLPAPAVSRVVGIDDWAWRRGQRYGTIVVDLERNRPVDLLPDRNAETVANWLERHPGIEVVARDRAGAYADGVRCGAPAAVQVADRWHLLRNLGDALAGALSRHHRDLRAAAATARETEDGPPASVTPMPQAIQAGASDRHALRRARFDEAAALHRQGWPVRRIARALGADRKTVRDWLRSGEFPSWRYRPRGSSVDRHAEYLNRRWTDGCRNAAQLWREIQHQGFRGRLRTVQRWVRALPDAVGRPAGIGGTDTAGWPVPSKQRASWLAVADAGRIDVMEQRFLDALVARSPELAALVRLGRQFSTMVRERQAELLDGWLAQAKNSALAGFADGIRRDLDAVRAALALPWSTGPVEGQISRLKTLKRAMYGRAGFELLRRRVLHAA